MNNSKNLLSIFVNDKKLFAILGGIVLDGAVLISLAAIAAVWFI